MHAIINEVKNPGGFPHNGLYREDLPKGGSFFRLKGRDSQVEVYEMVGKWFKYLFATIIILILLICHTKMTGGVAVLGIYSY